MSSGNSQIIKNYSFIPSTKQVVFSDFPAIYLAGVKLITNVADQIIIYQFNEPTKGGSVSGNVLTLTYDTTSMDGADKLMIVYEEPSAQSLESFVLKAVQSIDTKTVDDVGEKLDAVKESIENASYRPGQSQVASSLPVTLASDQKPIQDTEQSSVLTAQNTYHRRIDVSGYTTMAFTIKGTFSATVTFEGSIDGFTFFTITADTYNVSAQASTATATGQWAVGVGALKAVQLRASSFTSGAINITSRLSSAYRQQALPPGNNLIGQISGSVSISCISFTVATSVSTNLKNEDSASADADPLFPMGAVRRDTPVANDNTNTDGDYTQPKLTNYGATWVQPMYATRSDTYTATGSGTTVDISKRVMGAFSIQVVGTGGAATVWDVRIEGSNDNVNFTQIIAHTNADGDGLVKANATYFPCLYFRSRCAGLTLGIATNIIVYITGTSF
jgi:hypothetical protein